VIGRSSKTEKLYDMEESSMDEIGEFSPSETGGFIGVQVRLLGIHLPPCLSPRDILDSCFPKLSL
jgi:hypothetical protein